MAYRCVYIRKAEKMSLKHSNLVIDKDGKEVMIPLEDIAIILLEDQKSVVTTRLISSLATYYIGLIICDEKYKPVSITLPLAMHYKQLAVFGMQMKVKKPLNSQLWERIIKCKIRNQRIIVELTSKDQYTIDRLSDLEKSVKSADKGNAEAIAAKVFFNGVYGKSFTRKQKSEDDVNSALNYGYMILSTNLSRLLTMYGFNTIIGIHHVSMTNNFNLSYDLVEPFRPIVDYYVYSRLDELAFPLPLDIREGLIRLLVKPIRINEKNYLIQFAMEEMVLSYIKTLETGKAECLELPQIIEDVEIENETIF